MLPDLFQVLVHNMGIGMQHATLNLYIRAMRMRFVGLVFGSWCNFSELVQLQPSTNLHGDWEFSPKFKIFPSLKCKCEWYLHLQGNKQAPNEIIC